LSDPFLRRLEATAIVVCLVMAAAALGLYGGRAAAAVLGGGLLIGVSYWTISSSVRALTDRQQAGAPTPRVGWIVMKVFTRYALLALLAYVMIARLRLHPLGLLLGTSSVVAAASVEACRLLLKKS
jgi:lipopolysaccharide export LptBFGC system permease protein LptF